MFSYNWNVGEVSSRLSSTISSAFPPAGRLIHVASVAHDTRHVDELGELPRWSETFALVGFVHLSLSKVRTTQGDLDSFMRVRSGAVSL
jgi:hypothetical protein